MFRTPPSDAIQGQVLAQVVVDALGEGKTVNTASRNDAYGDALVSEFTKAYEAAGGTVGKNVSYNPDATSLNSEAQQIVDGNPDGWVITDYTGTWPKLGQELVRRADGLREGEAARAGRGLVSRRPLAVPRCRWGLDERRIGEQVLHSRFQ